MIKYLIGWKGYAAAALLGASVAGWLGWSARDVLADRDQAILQSQYDDYKAEVATDAATTNARNLAELARLGRLQNQLQEELLQSRRTRIEASQNLTEPLRETQDESTIGPALSDYLDRLRDYQRAGNDH